MIGRGGIIRSVEKALRNNPVVMLGGPRQAGKTTLARTLAEQRGRAIHFDLEDPAVARLMEDPMTILKTGRAAAVAGQGNEGAVEHGEGRGR